MQVTSTQSPILMLLPEVAAQAHQSLMDRRPDLAEAEQQKTTAASQTKARTTQPANSIDILV